MKTYINTGTKTVQLVEKTEIGKQWYVIKPGATLKMPDAIAKCDSSLQETEAVTEKELPAFKEDIPPEYRKKRKRKAVEGNTFAANLR